MKSNNKNLAVFFSKITTQISDFQITPRIGETKKKQDELRNHKNNSVAKQQETQHNKKSKKEKPMQTRQLYKTARSAKQQWIQKSGSYKIA